MADQGLIPNGASGEVAAWARQAGETAKAFSAFCTYRDLGPSRSLDSAYAEAKGLQKGDKRAAGSWQRWYREHRWAERAEAYDAHLDQAKLQEEARKWQQRGAAIAEEQFQIAEALMERARQMLAFPLTKQTITQADDEGRAVAVTVEPASWNFSTVAQMAKVGVELGRLAVGLPTSSTRMRVEQLVESELNEALDRLEAKLSKERYEEVLSIIAGE